MSKYEMDVFKYNQLKLLTKIIEHFYQTDDEFFNSILSLIKKHQELYYTPINKFFKQFKQNEKKYKELFTILNCLPDEFDKFTTIKQKATTYKIYKQIINKFDILKNDYNRDRRSLQLLIQCSYFDGISEHPFQEQWNTFDEKTINKQREEFRKLFRYFVWDKDKYILTNLNQKSGAKQFEKQKDTIADKFINGNSNLINAVKVLMKINGTTPLINYRTSKKNYQNHIYLSVFVLNNDQIYIYIGRTKESTRYRWGYGSGHLFKVFHYVARGGKYNLPSQITDLFTLYFGPSHQIIFTLETDVLDTKLDEYEKAYQYFFHTHGKLFGITGYLHNKLKDTMPKKYEEVYNMIFVNINDNLIKQK